MCLKTLLRGTPLKQSSVILCVGHFLSHSRLFGCIAVQFVRLILRGCISATRLVILLKNFEMTVFRSNAMSLSWRWTLRLSPNGIFCTWRVGRGLDSKHVPQDHNSNIVLSFWGWKQCRLKWNHSFHNKGFCEMHLYCRTRPASWRNWKKIVWMQNSKFGSSWLLSCSFRRFTEAKS